MKKKPVIFLSLFILLFSYCSPHKEKSKDPIQKKEVSLDQIKAKLSFQGRIVFQSDLDGDNEIYLLTSSQLKKLTDNSWSDEYPRWSPDGTKIVFAANPSRNFDIFVMNEDGSAAFQATDSADDETGPAWLPGGKEIAFTKETKSGLGKRFSLWKTNLETKQVQKLIPDFDDSNSLANFSPLSPLMVFTGKRMLGWDVFVYDFEKKVSRSLTEGGKSCRAIFSRDGKKLAYVSSKTDGKGDIWVMNPDGTDKIRMTERKETYDYFPSWSPDGKYIVFCSSLKNTPHKGPWSLYLVKVSTKRVLSLFSSSGRDLFPDWR